MNSRNKGCRGERSWRDFLISHGYTARRGQQFSGSSGSPDVVCEELGPFFHFEVKTTERLNLEDALEQAHRDCGGSKWLVVAHKKNREDWQVTMNADDWIDLVKEWKERSK